MDAKPPAGNGKDIEMNGSFSSGLPQARDASGLVPKGHLIIAQRFSVGEVTPAIQVPKGRLKKPRFQPSLLDFSCYGPNPTLKRWANLSLSLRDTPEPSCRA